jgi:signal transduction histidine kinase
MSDLIQEMRRISDELYPPVLTHLRINEVLRWLAEQLGEQHDFRINIETKGDFPPLDAEKKYFIYAAVRELVHNISKHADAKLVWLAMSAEPGEIMITVQDDGIGFDQALVENLSHREGGFGLFHIQMRLEQFGGVLAIRSKPGEGTAISIKIPVAENLKGSVS